MNDYYAGPDGSGINPFTTARAEDVRAQLQAVADGFDLLPSPDALLFGSLRYLVDTGGTNAITVAFPVSPGSYFQGLQFSVKVAQAVTGPSTINVNGLGVKPLINANGAALSSGDISAGGVVNIVYDGASFRVVGGVSNEFARYATTVAAPDGSVFVPSISFSRDPDTGFYLFGDGAIGFAANAGLAGFTSSAGITGYGAFGQANYGLRSYAPSGTNNNRAGVSLWSTFATGLDTLTRRTSDIVTGFTGSGWGTEYLDLCVGTGGTNDIGSVTTGRMRIHGNGNVGIGSTGQPYRLEVSKSDNMVANFRCPDTTLTYSTDIGISNGNSGGTFTILSKRPNGEFWIYNDAAPFAVYTSTLNRLTVETTGATRPGADNAYTLGTPGNRWSTIYAATGAINTSDARDKNWRGGMSASELAAAKEIGSAIGVYRWIASIQAKGGDARYHVGVKAQEVMSIMTAHGLDAMTYGFLCYNEWEATPARPAQGDVPACDAVPAGNRYGIRADELCMFLIAAQEQRIAALEASHG